MVYLLPFKRTCKVVPPTSLSRHAYNSFVSSRFWTCQSLQTPGKPSFKFLNIGCGIEIAIVANEYNGFLELDARRVDLGHWTKFQICSFLPFRSFRMEILLLPVSHSTHVPQRNTTTYLGALSVLCGSAAFLTIEGNKEDTELLWNVLCNRGNVLDVPL